MSKSGLLYDAVALSAWLISHRIHFGVFVIAVDHVDGLIVTNPT
jgi:hypothetical protein